MPTTDFKMLIKHYIKKVLRRPDPGWLIRRFEKGINSETWEKHDAIVRWAENLLEKKEEVEKRELYKKSEDPVVRQGYDLRKKTVEHFKDKLKELLKLRVLVHLPSPTDSPGGFSIFLNLVQSLNFLGVSARALHWDESIHSHLYDFQPTVLITSDNTSYLRRIEWGEVRAYREGNTLKLGLTASLEEYGNSPLKERLEWAKEHGVDFYYSFRPRDYIEQRVEYRPFFEEGYSIISMEFGVNILHYYPVPGIERDLDYVFFASVNSAKVDRYVAFLPPICGRYPGFLDGPGWDSIEKCILVHYPRDLERFIYARARVGINLHIENQIRWACEVNERTYHLAACGVPQLVDNSKLLYERFDEKSLFIAENPQSYRDLFEEILHNPQEAQERAVRAQRQVFERYTTFHRAEYFALAISSLL